MGDTLRRRNNPDTISEDLKSHSDNSSIRNGVFENPTDNNDIELEPLRSTSEILLEMLIILYLGLVALTGIAFSFASAIHTANTPTSTTYSHVFLIYLYGVGCCILVALLFLISKYQKKGMKSLSTDQEDIKPELVDLPANCQGVEHSNSFSSDTPLPEGVTRCIDQDSHGVSFYMRMGIVIFTTGILILYLLILLEPSDALSKQCVNFKIVYPLMIYYIMEIVFVILQSYMLFKHHRVIIRMHIPLVKFMIAHLVATNIARWSFGIIQEAHVYFGYYAHILFNVSAHVETSHILSFSQSRLNTTDHNVFSVDDITTYFNGTKDITNLKTTDDPFNSSTQNIPKTTTGYVNGCDLFEAISISAAHYLAPCIVEYSLVCVSITLKMFWAIGGSEHAAHSNENENSSNTGHNLNNDGNLPNQDFNMGSQNHLNNYQDTADDGNFISIKTITKCHKANLGLFAGLIMFSAFFVFLILNFLNEKKMRIYSKIVALIMISFTNPLLMYAIYHICFKSVKFRETNAVLILDQVLITFTGINAFVYNSFAVISSFGALIDYINWDKAITLAIYMFTCLHIVLQTGFLNDALKRRVTDEEAAHYKPARTVLTLLIFLNISFWMNKSFRSKYSEFDKIHINFYGAQAWCIIVNLFLPLNIFYSFHASVILAEIWHQAYHPASRRTQFQNSI